MVFNDQRVTEHFYPKIWICASDDFDEKRLIKAIVESIKGRPLLGDMASKETSGVVEWMMLWNGKLHIGRFDNLKAFLKKEGEEQFPVLEEMEILSCPVFVFLALSSIKKLKVYRVYATVFRRDFRKLCKISHFYNLKDLPSCLAGLNALERLEIRFCNTLESLPAEGVKGLTSLTELSVYACNMLKCLPDGLQHLTALTSLTIGMCPTLIKHCEKGIGEDWHKIALIPYLDIRNN
ncbi:hypothetical protein MTR67_036633 [Solanum verrucosum]|uniref:Uncharacterized protein n=1 Tax=Solanum verrucosum TaxID=315347 RepID=A0AAF0ZMN8_SOLVR|nr:hypothetical protein MTR67_036633 [Solanum verrucosum]